MMVQAWRERAPALIVLAAALLLAVGLFALIWSIIHSPEPPSRQPRIIQLLLVPPIPPQRPPEPARETVQRVPQAPPPVPVPPKKLVQHRRDSVASAPTPKPKPAPPQPKTRSPAAADPLSLDAPPDWRQFALPQGANSGNVIGGNGDNGGGSGCGGANTYLTIVTSQVRNVFSRDQKMDGLTFHVQAQLWFDDLGAVQRSQLLQSTGKAGLDASIKTVLGAVNVGRGMPQCIQPVTVWVNQPWDGKSTPTDAHMETWQSRTQNWK
jgi:hypothetical protein